MAINLEGVNEAIFQDLYDGDEDMFVTVLKTFVEKAPASIEKLANPANETLKDYAISVHALKGACASVCAEELRQKAYKLEQLSKAGDLDAVLEGNSSLINELESLIGRAKNWLNSHQ